MNALERMKQIFSQALEKPAGPERDAFLTEACQGDSALRGQVQSLLLADDQAGAFLGKTLLVPPSRSHDGPNSQPHQKLHYARYSL